MAAVVSDLSPSAFDDKARADLLKGEGSGKSDVVGEVRYRYMVRRLACARADEEGERTNESDAHARRSARSTTQTTSSS